MRSSRGKHKIFFKKKALKARKVFNTPNIGDGEDQMFLGCLHYIYSNIWCKLGESILW